MNFSNPDTIKSLVLDHYELQATHQALPGYEDLNIRLTSPEGTDYLLKIAAPTEQLALLEMQDKAFEWLEHKETGLILPNTIPDKEGKRIIPLKNEAGQIRLMRLLRWVPGRLWVKVNPHSPELYRNLGHAIGRLSYSLEGFEHPAAFRPGLSWDSAQAMWLKEKLDVFPDPAQRELATCFYDLIEKEAFSRFEKLRMGVIHGDVNDYNTLLSEDAESPTVVGMIDFGDMCHSHLVNELAIAAAYALMGEKDPLEAALPLISAYHEAFPLTEVELGALFPLIATRLLISLTNSTIDFRKHPENTYIIASQKRAWDLLGRMRKIAPALAHYSFRHACGLEACPAQPYFVEWVRKQQAAFHAVVNIPEEPAQIQAIDLSVGSLELGENHNFEEEEAFEERIRLLIRQKDASLGIGRYDEVRPIYTTDAYAVEGNEGPRWRTVHLGVDFFQPATNPVYAPLDGIVYSFQDNHADRDYGPTLILEHKVEEGLRFYTLFGHLSLASMQNWEVGMEVKKGQQIGTLGERQENVGWPPHLHFQIMLDLLGMEGDFPGVAFPHLREVFTSICPDPGLLLGLDLETTAKPEEEMPALMEARSRHLGPCLSLSYEEPLHIVRASRQYLYDRKGRRYLDTANNVPHVGHQHPRIVAAARRQLAVLNTNTRYLHKNILAYAEELCATLPLQLEVVHFVNSGSEANELALRMARAYSGQRDFLVLEGGYHGNTNDCVAISSYKYDGPGGQGAPPWVHELPMPDSYRGVFKRDDPEAGRKFADPARITIESLARQGRRPAAFIGESILSCGGQIVPPPGYLAEIYRLLRAAGGLCIADEVQTGFGRVGEAFWAFELQNVIPDIVTMGKPIGNGHPLGAVVCTRSVADAFHNGMEYFNTFGGNPVSCSIGREVLKVIQEEDLQENARKMGAYLIDGLKALQSQHPIIGDVRGHGLFLGFELVRDRLNLEPADLEATYLANRMRRHGILMSTDGPLHNVIKIKPPMVFGQADADFLLETLDKVLSEDLFELY